VSGIPSPRRVAASVNHRRTRTVEDSRMPLTEHLRELRNRVGKALLAFLASLVVAFVFRDTIMHWLTGPYCDLPAKYRAQTSGDNCQLYFFDITGAFMIELKVAAIAAALLSAPVWLYQLWSFITPGLHRHERRWSLSFVGISLVLFAIGGVFAYVTLETGLRLLLGFGGNTLVSLLSADKYLSYVIAMILIFGVSFEVPLLVCLLNLAGLVTTARLRSWRRAEIFLTFVFAAVVTPSQDPFTMLALGLPMVLLYEVALFVGWANDRRKRLRGDDSVYSDLDDDASSPLDFDDTGDARRLAQLTAQAQQDGRAGRRARRQLAELSQAASSSRSASDDAT